jgi:hypothetical protein
MAQKDGRSFYTAHVWIQYQISPNWICDVRSGTGTGFIRPLLIYPAYYHYTSALYKRVTSRRHNRHNCGGSTKEIVLSKSKSKSKSKSHCDWRSVSQYVLVSSPIWDFWPEIFFLKVTVLSFSGRPLWREVGSVMCQSLLLKSTTVSNYLQLFTSEFKIYKVLNTFTKTIKYIQYVQASFSPGFVQQIMPYLLIT